MTLGALLDSIETDWARGAKAGLTPGALALGATGVSCDSRTIRRGEIFVAIRGLVHEGLKFVPQAVERGALAVVAETLPAQRPDLPWIVVPDARRALAVLAAAFYGNPSREMSVVGVTGTNGKTTTTWLLGSIFEACGIRAGLLGTVMYRVGAEEREAARTTPEAPDIQRMLREMARAGCTACAMEVSSHALVLHRVDEIRFRVAAYSNLTRDHLDFHGDMESYAKSKRRLFEILDADGTAVVNLDDPRGLFMAAPAARALTYGISREADVRPGPIASSLDGLSFSVRTPAGAIDVRTRLVGRPNIYNILMAIGVSVALDLPLDNVARGLAAVEGVPGRFEVVSTPEDEVSVVVDYAHTDDALRNLLETARPLAENRLITVFGCGGDRDRTKRPLMGAVAARLSDLVVVTSDNPRSENPQSIIEEILRGIPAEKQQPQDRRLAVIQIPDRRAAIERAIAIAEPGDMVLLAGKGHEKYQVIGDRVLPFDDAAVAREVLEARRSRTAPKPERERRP